MIKRALPLGLLILASWWCQSAAADAIRFQEHVSPSTGYLIDDVMIRQSVATTSQNNRPDMPTGQTASTDKMRSLYSFDLTPLYNLIPNGQTIRIDCATMTITQGTTNQGGGTGLSIRLQLKNYSHVFSESTATWNAPGTGDSTAGGDLSGADLSTVTFTSLSGGGKENDTLPSTAALQAAILSAVNASDHTFRGLLYAPDVEAGSGSNFARIVRAWSEGQLDPGIKDYQGPRLDIQYTFVTAPEPATLALVGMGAVAALGGFRRRKGR